jgi:propanol-preferring alcohol dehydrogenase
MGNEAKRFLIGTRVGVAWLHHTCGVCRYCSRGAENLCETADFTGYSVNGGYAEYITAPQDFVYELPHAIADAQASPLLCAGIIGYRSLRLTGVPHGGKLGMASVPLAMWRFR